MKAASALAFGLLLGASAASAQTLSCQTIPGNGLCRDIQNVTSSFGFTCTGDACYRIWQGQLEAMQRFSYSFQRDVPFGTAAEADIGTQAAYAAWYICSATSTGDCGWMEALFHAKYDALTSLVEIQQNAGMVPTTCQLQYSCQ